MFGPCATEPDVLLGEPSFSLQSHDARAPKPRPPSLYWAALIQDVLIHVACPKWHQVSTLHLRSNTSANYGADRTRSSWDICMTDIQSMGHPTCPPVTRVCVWSLSTELTHRVTGVLNLLFRWYSQYSFISLQGLNFSVVSCTLRLDV